MQTLDLPGACLRIRFYPRLSPDVETVSRQPSLDQMGLHSTGQRNSLIEYVWPRKLGIGRRGRNLPQSSAQQLSFHPTHQLQRPRALRMTRVRKKRFEQPLLRLVDDQRLHAFFRAQDG